MNTALHRLLLLLLLALPWAAAGRRRGRLRQGQPGQTGQAAGKLGRRARA